MSQGWQLQQQKTEDQTDDDIENYNSNKLINQ